MLLYSRSHEQYYNTIQDNAELTYSDIGDSI